MDASLLIVNGSKSGDFVTIGRVLVLGRSEDCSIRPMSPMVSRRHCRIIFEKGSYLIEDLGSTNGTTLNGKLVTCSMELKDGDKIGVANAQFKFVMPNETKTVKDENSTNDLTESDRFPIHLNLCCRCCGENTAEEVCPKCDCLRRPDSKHING